MSNVSLSFYVSEENAAYIKEQVDKKGVKRYNKSNWLDELIDHLRTKSKPKPPAVKKTIELPEGLNLVAWEAWINYRKLIKKPLKTASQAKNLINLGKTMEGQLAVVNQSINNEYQGLFEVKGNEANKPAAYSDGLSDSKRAILEARAKRDQLKQGMRPTMGSDGGNVFDQVGEEEWCNSQRIVDGGFTDIN